jgi:hypothetical protein
MMDIRGLLKRMEVVRMKNHLINSNTKETVIEDQPRKRKKKLQERE